MSELNECQQRHYLAECALNLGRHGVSKISEKWDIAKIRFEKAYGNSSPDILPERGASVAQEVDASPGFPCTLNG